jgi:hypothetical protein
MPRGTPSILVAAALLIALSAIGAADDPKTEDRCLIAF